MNAGAQLPLEVPLPSARLERAARHARWAASMRQVVGRQSRPLARSCSSAAAQSSISRRRASDGSSAARNLCSAINRSGVDCTF